MADNESYILKKREPLDPDRIILEQNRDAIAEFLDEPFTAIAESITGALAGGAKAWTPMTGRVFQGALNGKLFQQVSREIKYLREKGKIPADYAEKKLAIKAYAS